MSGTDDLVVTPAVPVRILPGTILARGYAVAIRKSPNILFEEHQAV
jgi:hypothetical protein